MKTICVLLAASAFVPTAARAADREFRDVVEAISDEFRTRPLRIPFMGLANAVAFVARPAGTRHIDIAVFENLETRNRTGRDLPDAVRRAVGGSWKPFLQIRSTRDDGSEENVLVYMRQDGRDWKLLVATLQRRDATVVQLRLNADALQRWLKDPLESVRHGGRYVE